MKIEEAPPTSFFTLAGLDHSGKVPVSRGASIAVNTSLQRARHRDLSSLRGGVQISAAAQSNLNMLQGSFARLPS